MYHNVLFNFSEMGVEAKPLEIILSIMMNEMHMKFTVNTLKFQSAVNNLFINGKLTLH